jgi:hypothetical protein
MVAALAPAPVLAKFSRFAMADFCAEHPELKKCCHPSCGITIRMKEAGRPEVLCDPTHGGCGTVNCGVAGCWQEAHFPCECSHVSKWMQKCEADGGLFAWLDDGCEQGVV